MFFFQERNKGKKMVCPFAIVVRASLVFCVVKTMYDAVCIYCKRHPAAPAKDDDAKKLAAQPAAAA